MISSRKKHHKVIGNVLFKYYSSTTLILFRIFSHSSHIVSQDFSLIPSHTLSHRSIPRTEAITAFICLSPPHYSGCFFTTPHEIFTLSFLARTITSIGKCRLERARKRELNILFWAYEKALPNII